ncbi:hypothetical protein GCM10023087_34450 [Microbacterium rhizosphaerae]
MTWCVRVVTSAQNPDAQRASRAPSCWRGACARGGEFVDMGFLSSSISLMRLAVDGNGAAQEHECKFSQYCMLMQCNRGAAQE